MTKEKEKEEERKNELEKEEEEEEEETCGFCAYMKGGSCKNEFIGWEKCVDAAKEKEEDFVAKCFEQTAKLRECMLRDPGYYGEMDDGDGEGESGGGDGDGDGEGGGSGKEEEKTKTKTKS
jgi:hypothetical protein